MWCPLKELNLVLFCFCILSLYVCIISVNRHLVLKSYESLNNVFYKKKVLVLHTPGQEGHIICCHHCSSVVSVCKLHTFHRSCWGKKGTNWNIPWTILYNTVVFFVNLKFKMAITLVHTVEKGPCWEIFLKNPLKTENQRNPMDGPLNSLCGFFFTTAQLKFKIQIISVHTSIKKLYINRWAIEAHVNLWLHCFNCILIFVLCCLCILNSFCKIFVVLFHFDLSLSLLHFYNEELLTNN